MKLHKVKLADLDLFIESDFYKALPIKPISSMRVKSYLNNKKAKPDDIVLYYIMYEEKLIAFRTVLVDCVETDTVILRFCWLSGNWVDENYRGKGFAIKSLKEVIKDWDNKIIFTNYSMLSLESYEKSKYFNKIYSHNGIRAYFMFSIRKRLNVNSFFKAFLFFIDLIIKMIALLFRLFYFSKIDKAYSFEVENFPDEDCLSYVEKNKNNYVFKRGKNEFNWIFQYPWMTDNNSDYLENYPFSSYAKEFYYKTVKIFNDNKFEGFFCFSVRDGHLKTLCFYFSDMYNNAVSKWLKKYVSTNNLSVMTVFDKEISKIIKNNSFPFLRIRNYGMDIYSSFEFNRINNFKVLDGDGDYIFT